MRGLLVTDLETTLARLPEGLARKARANAAYAGLLPRNDDGESDLEALYLSITRAADLSEPAHQRRIGHRRTDFVYEEAMLIVEVDGDRAHDNPPDGTSSVVKVPPRGTNTTLRLSSGLCVPC